MVMGSRLKPASPEAIERVPGVGDQLRRGVRIMLITTIIMGRQERIEVHYGKRNWIDIGQLHLEVTKEQLDKIHQTIHKAEINQDRTITAQ